MEPIATYRQRWLLDHCGRLAAGDMRRRYWTLANAVRLAPPLEEERLARAWRAVLIANPALRWSFGGDGSVRVLPPEAFPVLSVDARDWPPEETLRAAQGSALDLIEPEGGPLVALSHYRERSGSVLLLRFHHILVDGISVMLLVRELIGAYLLGAPPRAAATGNFPEFAAWQRAFVESPAGARQLDYWKRQLAGLPAPLPLAFDRPDDGRFSDGRYLSRTIDPGAARRARALAASVGAPLFRVLLAAFNCAIAAITGVPDAPVTSAIAARTQRRFAETIGWIANGTSLRCEIDEDESVADYCRRVSETVTGALENQDYPRSLIDAALDRDFPGIPSALDQIGFGVSAPLTQDDLGINALLVQPSGAWGDYRFEMLPLESIECARDFTLTALDTPRPEGEPVLSLSLNYRADVFDAATVERMGELYEAALDLMTRDEDRRIGEIVARLGAGFADLRRNGQRRPA